MIIFIIIGCWILSFFFNGIESGLLSINPVRLRQNVKRRVLAAMRLDRLLQRPERLLVTVLLCTNAADIIGLLLLTRQLVQRYGSLGFLYTMVVALPVYLFLLGVLPKALFRRFPFRALARLAGVLEFLTALLSPLLSLGAWIGSFFMPRAQKGQSRLFAAREELKQITTQSEHEGALTSTERAMIHNVVDFRGVKVRDVMVPAEKVVAMKTDTPVDEAVRMSATAGVDRVPVLGADGQPRGLLNVLDVLLDKDGNRSLAHHMRRIVMAADQEPAYRIVQRLRAARLGLAAVLDHEQQFCGIVTIEDLVRRLVSSTEAKA
jgi:CBS domain containing-hemolysin-like protein